MSSYSAKILWVDLTEGRIGFRDLSEEVTRKYIGGAGLAAKILWDETAADTEPFSPENLLIFRIWILPLPEVNDTWHSKTNCTMSKVTIL